MARRTSSANVDMERVTKTLRAVEDLQAKHEISIIKLSEPISSAFTQAGDADSGRSGKSGIVARRNDNNDDDNITTKTNPDETQQQQQRTSDVSNSSLDAPTPASLEADLAHYRELFAKLRFSYVEQVTKEKFIRAIVGDPPLIVSARDNADLEAANAASKARLKARKTDVAAMVGDLEVRGRDLARRWGRVARETAALRDLPAQTAALEAKISALRAEAAGEEGSDVDVDVDDDEDGGSRKRRRRRSELRLPLARTETLVAERRARMAELDRQLEQLAAQAPRKRKEAERLRAELAPLEAKRQNCAAAAREARRRKEAAVGSRVEDDLEERGRWWRASEAALKGMLDV